MKFYNTLSISIKDELEDHSDKLTSMLSQDTTYLKWSHKKQIINNRHTVLVEVVEDNDDKRFNPIKEFVKLVRTNEVIIKEYQPLDSSLSLSIDYEYDEQCNMEFWPEDLKLLGEHGIVLCISCWEKKK